MKSAAILVYEIKINTIEKIFYFKTNVFTFFVFSNSLSLIKWDTAFKYLLIDTSSDGTGILSKINRFIIQNLENLNGLKVY